MLGEYTSIDLGLSHENTYKIHPSVLINILNVFYRNVHKDFLIGILLGKTYPDYVNVTNTIFVPFTKTDDGGIEYDMEKATRMLEFQSNIYNETKVGWFITKPNIDLEVAALHKNFGKVLKSPTNTWNPLCLLIDTTLQNGKINFSGYISQPNRLYKEIFVPFQQVTTALEILPEDRTPGTLR